MVVVSSVVAFCRPAGCAPNAGTASENGGAAAGADGVGVGSEDGGAAVEADGMSVGSENGGAAVDAVGVGIIYTARQLITSLKFKWSICIT